MKQVSCVKVLNLRVFAWAYIWFGWKFNFQPCLLQPFDRNKIFELNEPFFQIFQSSLEVYSTKRKFPDNLGQCTLKIIDVLVQIQFDTSKTKLDI